MDNMSYMWNEFNIKTFDAETIVYRDGLYCPELSTIDNENINKKYDLPVHIIYVGELKDKNLLNVNVGADNQKVIITGKIKIKSPAVLNIFIKNAGKKSEINAHIAIENNSDFEYKCVAEHLYRETSVIVKNKLLAEKNSNTKMSGTAIIGRDCEKCVSDISFSAMADENAKIEFMPEQKIYAEPTAADHSANIYQPTDAQILYLRQSGLGGIDVQNVIKEAFLND